MGNKDANERLYNMLGKNFTIQGARVVGKTLGMAPKTVSYHIHKYLKAGTAKMVKHGIYSKVDTLTSQPDAVPSNFVPPDTETKVHAKTLKDCMPIELMAELWRRGYRWTEMKIEQSIPVQNVMDFVENMS